MAWSAPPVPGTAASSSVQRAPSVRSCEVVEHAGDRAADPRSVFDAILAGEVGARGQVMGQRQGAERFSRSGLLSAVARDAIAADLTKPSRADPAYPLSRMPPVLTALGIDNSPLVVRKSVVAKAMGKHGLSLDEALQSIEGLADPIMVFVSATVSDGLVALVESTDGKNLVVAIHSNGEVGRMEVSVISSIHAKDKATSILGWVEGGLARYVNKRKADAWFQSKRPYLPREGITHRRSMKILRHRDVFKGDAKYSRRFSPDGAPVPETAVDRVKAANEKYGPPAGFHQPPLPVSPTMPDRSGFKGGMFTVREVMQDTMVYLRAAQAATEAATGESLMDSLNVAQRTASNGACRDCTRSTGGNCIPAPAALSGRAGQYAGRWIDRV